MPSVRVPLKGEPGWDRLVAARRDYWSKDKHDELAPHFKASEFYTHDATPCPIVARAAMVRLCLNYLEPLRAKFGGSCLILSGYRHERYNQAIGGARNSQHVYEHTYQAVAADVRFPKGTPQDWAAEAKKIRDKQGGKGGIGVYPRAGFVHIDNREYRADWSG